jgi:hypothetical protein
MKNYFCAPPRKKAGKSRVKKKIKFVGTEIAEQKK